MARNKTPAAADEEAPNPTAATPQMAARPVPRSVANGDLPLPRLQPRFGRGQGRSSTAASRVPACPRRCTKTSDRPSLQDYFTQARPLRATPNRCRLTRTKRTSVGHAEPGQLGRAAARPEGRKDRAPWRGEYEFALSAELTKCTNVVWSSSRTNARYLADRTGVRRF